jgi:hypothetical protein
VVCWCHRLCVDVNVFHLSVHLSVHACMHACMYFCVSMYVCALFSVCMCVYMFTFLICIPLSSFDSVHVSVSECVSEYLVSMYLRASQCERPLEIILGMSRTCQARLGHHVYSASPCMYAYISVRSCVHACKIRMHFVCCLHCWYASTLVCIESRGHLYVCIYMYMYVSYAYVCAI